MEKRAGWGAEYPADLRNGEWEYAVFGPDTKLNEKANYKGCFQCHKPHEKQDFVISLASVKGGTGMAGGQPDVTISGFTFGPGKLTAAAGKPVTWVNGDDSPHQVTITGVPARGPVMTKGQSYAHTFASAGTYDYICGLHPQMKGQVEVK
jgi:plastocyanin